MSSLKDKIDLVTKQTEDNGKRVANHPKDIGEMKPDVKELKKDISNITNQLSQLVSLTVGSLESGSKQNK